MRYKESINEFVVGNLLFPFTSYLMNRKGILRKYKRLVKSECYSTDQLNEIQLRKLIKALEYADRWVPYYRKIFKKTGFSPKDVKNLEDLKALPLLSRQDVIDYRKDMIDYRYHNSVTFADNSNKGAGEPNQFALFHKHKLVRNTSSGSTGVPTIFYENGSITSSNWANEMRMRSWYGIKPGAKEMRMARISTEYMPKNRTLLMRKYLWNQMILPGTNLSDADYKICYESVKKFRPKVFWGFTSALFGFAEYIENNGKDISDMRPQLIITWAAPLYEHEKRKLSKVFDCYITNIYGTREVGHIAGYCPHGSLHINQESHLVEIADIDGSYQEAESGEILVTTLEDTPMPFIRYRMGDVGEVASSKCFCGRSLQVFKKFLGRTGEVFITKDGQMISPNFWCRTFMNDKVAEAFKRFQVIYKKDGNIRIRLVRKNSNSHNAESFLRTFLQKNFHHDIRIDFEYVEKIEPQISGKYQMVINEAKGKTTEAGG